MTLTQDRSENFDSEFKPATCRPKNFGTRHLRVEIYDFCTDEFPRRLVWNMLNWPLKREDISPILKTISIDASFSLERGKKKDGFISADPRRLVFNCIVLYYVARLPEEGKSKIYKKKAIKDMPEQSKKIAK